MLLVSALLSLTSAMPAFAQVVEAGPQVLTFHSDVDDTEQPYALYLPPNYDPGRAYPLVMSLHGAGSNHRLNLKRVFGVTNAPGETDVEASRYFGEWKDVDYIVAAPFARGTMGYQGVSEKDVLDVLADVKRRFSVDENRTYLTGLSMGGGGTLWVGLSRPDIWAAIAPVCPAPPPGTEALAGNALNVPVKIFQGGADPVVRPEATRAWVERLRGLGTAVEYVEYPGVGHDSWDPAYENGQIFEWFDGHVRNPHPERVRFASAQYRYDRAYWVRFDALTPGTLARIDAKFTGANRLEVATSELDGFTLHVAGHPSLAPGQRVELRIDGQAVRVPAADSLSFQRISGRWAAGKHVAAADAKRPGAEGPIREAIAGRHLYVYGTGGDPSPEELAARREQAERAANWSVYRGPFWGRVMVFPRVAADTEVRPSDVESSNLVLFGTRETNGIIARYADRLPMHLSGDARDHGLVYVFPMEGRYVLVSSGVPWWQTTGAEGAPASLPFGLGVDAFRLNGLQDYLLFRGTPENAVVQGRFDNRWRLPSRDAAAMEASGAVQVSRRAGLERGR